MTIEIKELVIKATVAGGTQTGDGKPVKPEINTQEIVNLCVAEVIKILKREKERSRVNRDGAKRFRDTGKTANTIIGIGREYRF